MSAYRLPAALLCALTASAVCLAAEGDASTSRSSSPVLRTAQAASPSITSLLPNSGPFGTWVTISGGGFTSANTIEFRGTVDSFDIAPIASHDGTTLQFQVTTCPPSERQCPTRYITPGTYAVIVANSGGRSNQASFVLTARAGQLTSKSIQ